MKKIFIFMIAILLVFSLVACGGQKTNELKTLISSMELDYEDTDYAGEDYDGVEIGGHGAVVLYDPTFETLMVIYASKGKLAMLDFAVTESENGEAIYITYLAIGYIDQKNELYLSQGYNSAEVDGYRIDMTMKEWTTNISYYSVETVLDILVDLGIIEQE
jgi:hypothetical protein